MTEFDIFIDHWHWITLIWSKIAISVAGIVLVYYFLMLASQRTLTKKHKFINTKEIKLFWYAGLSVTISFALYVNALMVRVHDTDSNFALVSKVFVALIIGFVIGYTISKYLYAYYPIRLAKRLHKIRFTPRHNPSNGNEMRLLTEDQEDVHLTQEMIEQENVYANEYDVWMDDETGYKTIEKYAGNLSLNICENCNYRTAKEYKAGVEKEPTGTKEGLYVRRYRCSHCNHEQKKEAAIPPFTAKYQKA